MSARESQVALLAAGTTPAITPTALTAFKALGNTLTLQITTVTGGAGVCTLSLQSSNDNTNWLTVYDLNSAASWTINVNTAGAYQITLPVGLIPTQYYRVLYSCENAAGTIGINGVLWENPSGSVDVSLGDIHTSITDLEVEGKTAHDAADADNPIKIGGRARTSQITAVANNDRSDVITNAYGEVVIAGHTWPTSSTRFEEIDPLSTQYATSARVDTTDETATTHYYPSATGASMGGARRLSASVQLIDADGTLTLTLEATNDADTSTGLWLPCTRVLSCDYSNDAAYDGTTGNASYAVTNGTLNLQLDCDKFNYDNYRWVLVASGATNTVQVHERTHVL